MSGTTSIPADLGYEQARDELIEVVRRLETGGLTLEESLAAWERGEALAKHCQAKLDGARARLDAALAADAGTDADGPGEADG
jgi:exodeoxyribonuclease VII small subunit